MCDRAESAPLGDSHARCGDCPRTDEGSGTGAGIDTGADREDTSG